MSIRLAIISISPHGLMSGCCNRGVLKIYFITTGYPNLNEIILLKNYRTKDVFSHE